MATENEIKIIVKAEVEKAKKDLSSVKASAKDVGSGLAASGKAGAEGLAQMGGQTGILGSVISKLPGPVKIAAVAIGAVVGAVAGFIAVGTKFADIAAKQEQAFNKLGAITKATGTNFDEAKIAAQSLAADGLMSFQEAASSLSNLLASGMSLPKAIQLLKIAKDNAVNNRQAHYELGEAVVTFTEGVKNENSMLTDSVGITKNYSKILQEGAQAMGRTVESLTAREKSQIVANGFIKEGAAFEGEAAKASDTYAGAKARSKVALEKLSVALGQAFTPAMKTANGLMETAAKKATEWARSLFGVEEQKTKAQKTTDEITLKERQLIELRKQASDLEIKAIIDSDKKAKKQADQKRAQADYLEGEINTLKYNQLMTAEKEKQADLINKIKTAGFEPEAVKEQKGIIGKSDESKATDRTAQLASQLARINKANEDWNALIEKTRTLWASAGNEILKDQDEIIKKAIEYNLLTKYKTESERAAFLKEASNSPVILQGLADKIKATDDAKKAQEELNAALKQAQTYRVDLSEVEAKDIETVKKLTEEKKRLIGEGLQAGIASEEELTLMTSLEIKKRIQLYKDLKTVFQGVMSGIKEISQAVFDYEKQLRDQKLADDIHALETTRDATVKAAEDKSNAEIAALEKTNEYSKQISDLEKQHSAEAQAEKDAELAAEKSRLEAELALAVDADERARISNELKTVNKQIAEENYQKNIDALKEKERIKAEEIEVAKAKSKDEADKARVASETSTETQIKALKKIAWQQDKDAKKSSAYINAALAIITGFAQLGPIGGAVAAITTGVATGFQIAAIDAQKFPEYRVGSNYIAQDQVAMLHEGERVLTAAENKTWNQNMGGVTIVMNGVNNVDQMANQVDQYLKRHGGFAT